MIANAAAVILATLLVFGVGAWVGADFVYEEAALHRAGGWLLEPVNGDIEWEWGCE